MTDSTYIPYIETYGKSFVNYAKILEQGAADQMSHVLQQEWVVKGALMPDAHVGYSLPIGGVVACNNVISAAFVGVDIGCGVCAQKLVMDKNILLEHKFDIRNKIAETIPRGYDHRKKAKPWPSYIDIPKTDWAAKFFMDEGGFKQLDTLGGGNHFIEVGLDETDTPWIVIHSGSRGVGNKMAKYYMAQMHPEGQPKDGAYGVPFDSVLGQDYFVDMNFMLEFALANRVYMIEDIIKALSCFDKNVQPADVFINRTHNHAEKKGDYIIHRKGATHAEKDMLGVVPGHMLHGSYIVKGKGCEDSLCSSSHGAGRVLGRKAAIRSLDLAETTKQVNESGVATTFRHKADLDEAPGAYKEPTEVMQLQSDLIDIIHHIRPVVNVKG